MKQLIKDLVGFVLIVGSIVAIGIGIYHFAINTVERSEIVECQKLERYSKEFAETGEFYVTRWQKSMCDAHGMNFGGNRTAPILMLDGGRVEEGFWYYAPGHGLFKMGNNGVNE